VLVSLLLLNACSQAVLPDAPPFSGGIPDSDLPPATPTFTPFQPLPRTPEAEAIRSASDESVALPIMPVGDADAASLPEHPALWIDPALPQGVHAKLSPPEVLEIQTDGDGLSAALRLTYGAQDPLSHWVYVLAVPFSSLEEELSSTELRQAWESGSHRIHLDPAGLAAFSALWGAPGENSVQVFPEDELLARAWESPNAWTLLPFEALQPRWKVLAVDGASPLRVDFVSESYSLSVPIALQGDPALSKAVRALYGPDSPQPMLPASNRLREHLTTLAMTGVTALVRATAYAMESRGVTYPGRDIGDWLRSADITHISNEVPFARDCPPPNPVQADVRFCSDPRYIALLEDVGADVIELTGDHFQDWGAAAMRLTLDLYKERGWLYYGGGANLQEGRQAVTLEHNGNRLAFIGCNGKGGSFAQAGANRPGAVTCDFDYMESEIARLRAEGYLPVVTFQHFEYYTYRAQPNQVRDFRRVAAAGAVIVSGSQAHQPQAFEFYGGALIHYGLGNLFFDQYDVSPATRQGFIDRHIFYENRYLGAELLAIQFVDYARARPMTPPERRDLLQSVFAVSNW
jgi:poly-gamma-glutamate synthesis protein (capsule biosynthesis protein)